MAEYSNEKAPRIVFRRGGKIDLCVLDQERHLRKCLLYLNDPDVVRYMIIGRFPLSLEKEADWFLNQTKSEDKVVLAIEAKNGLYLGNIGLHLIDWINRQAELGAFIGPADKRGRGLGTEAERLMLDYAWSLGLAKVYGRIFSENKASLRAAEKNNGQIEGTLRKHIYKNGKWHDLIMIAFFPN